MPSKKATTASTKNPPKEVPQQPLEDGQVASPQKLLGSGETAADARMALPGSDGVMSAEPAEPMNQPEQEASQHGLVAPSNGVVMFSMSREELIELLAALACVRYALSHLELHTHK